jgi:hypothetical protein
MAERHLESLGNPVTDDDRRIANTALNSTDVGSV